MTKYLLDMHTLIWLIQDSSKISNNVKEMLKLPGNFVCLSAVSLWEVAIKASINKLSLKRPFSNLLSDLQRTDILILQIEDSYLQNLYTLPFIHKDPFDRLIISTALAENLTIITA